MKDKMEPKSIDFVTGTKLSTSISSVLAALEYQGVILNCAGVLTADTEELAALVVLQRQAQNLGRKFQLINVAPSLQKQLQSLPNLEIPTTQQVHVSWVEKVGTAVYNLFAELKSIFYLFTESIYWSTLGRFDKTALPTRGTAKQMLRLGSEAVPIVFILSFLIGITLALQSAIQLEILGASVFLARGIGVIMFTEIGPLITSIILAGRSGSAITAEIASMVVQEEVKALRTMGVHPVPFVVVPRFKAMSITVPILTYISVLAGILAGLAVTVFYSGLPPSLYFSELRTGVPLKFIWQCGVKALVFGWIIVLVASHKGFSVRGGADAVGKATTQCVVFSISAIIITDALFSFVFY
ncbi:MAG: ABC transporter permease [Fibrobacter sp.]|mgnify:CR=1 FL=1|nr:ABC transporter permease [Fibrobacter sp.]